MTKWWRSRVRIVVGTLEGVGFCGVSGVYTRPRVGLLEIGDVWCSTDCALVGLGDSESGLVLCQCRD